MRQYLSILSFVFILCFPAFADPAPSPDLDALRAKAEQGDATAQTNLGMMYYLGRGVAQDYVEAVKWWRKAAESGSEVAQYNFGLMYHQGLGVRRDDAEAVKWWRKAAEQGYMDAQDNLGLRYAKGEGVPRDYVTAYMWFSLAAAQGDRQASENLDITERNLTADERAEAQRMTREWQPTP